jgi:hypothetical protein
MLTIPSILGFELIVGSAVEFAISVITDDEEQQEEN